MASKNKVSGQMKVYEENLEKEKNNLLVEHLNESIKFAEKNRKRVEAYAQLLAGISIPEISSN